jgi:catechol 2,3-dioxygenase-like lactoylglutathione lyase family enzyme
MKMTVPMEIGMVVSDMDRMIDFYVNVLGLKVVGDANAAAGNSTKVGTTPYGYRIVRLQTPFGERIKFVFTGTDAPHPAPQTPKWVYDRHGLCYLTFIVEGIKDIAKELKEKGVTFLSEDVVEVRPGVFCLNTSDPEGNFIEFVEYGDIKAYRPDFFS